MTDGHAYKVAFDYQSSHAGAYQWVSGYDRIAADGTPDQVETASTPIGQQRTTGHYEGTVTAGCGDTWTGLRKLEGAPDGADFVLDDFTVTDLGPAEKKAACGTLALKSDETLEPGQKNKVEATFTNYEASEIQGASLSLDLPEGWQAEPAGPVTLDPVAPGAKATATWQVTPPVDAKYQPYQLSSKATYTVGDSARTLTAGAAVRTLPPPPTADTYASDLDWTAMDNGWGPAEKDMENGETGAACRRQAADRQRHRLRQGPRHRVPREDPLLPGRPLHLVHRRGRPGRLAGDARQRAVLRRGGRHPEGPVAGPQGRRQRLVADRGRDRRQVRRPAHGRRRRRPGQRPRRLGQRPLPLR